MKDTERTLWERRIEDYRTSKLTAVQWAEENNLSVHKLRYYINKTNKEKKQNISNDPKETQWVQIIVEESINNLQTSKPLTIIIGKARIEIDSFFDENILESVVKVLSKC